jgi:hypothetical protein
VPAAILLSSPLARPSITAWIPRSTPKVCWRHPRPRNAIAPFRSHHRGQCRPLRSGYRPLTGPRPVDNLWALGGEIIRDLNENPSLRKKNIKQILFDMIDDDGGPLIYGVSSEHQQRSFDSTCRKFYRFLGQPSC